MRMNPAAPAAFVHKVGSPLRGDPDSRGRRVEQETGAAHAFAREFDVLARATAAFLSYAAHGSQDWLGEPTLPCYERRWRGGNFSIRSLLSAMKLLPCLLITFCPFFVASLRAEPSGMAKRLIEQLHMQRVPQEGVWFSVSYVSNDPLPGGSLPARYHGKDHRAGSAIYDVMTREDFSALHKLQTDETWHFYGGDPIEMLLLYPDGRGETVVIGPDVFAGQRPQFTVPQGVWQGSAPAADGKEGYSFVGNQLSPAFDYGDFEIGYREELQKAYPAFAARIGQLTRAEFAAR